jgi:hypothetical protein
MHGPGFYDRSLKIDKNLAKPRQRT